jgi:hypothetical protein
VAGQTVHAWWCREVVDGFKTLDAFEELPTKKEGIFVMPLEPIAIQSSYVFSVKGAESDCTSELALLKSRFDAQSKELHKIRSTRLPG